MNCLLLGLILTALLSCKKDKEETEEVFLNVPFTVQSDNTGFNVVHVLDSATLSSVIGGDIDNLKTLELVEIKYQVNDYTGPAELEFTATIYISEAGGAGIQEIGTISNQNLPSLVNNEQTLAIQQDGGELFAELIKNPPHIAQLTFTGITNPKIAIFFVLAGVYKFKQQKDNPA